MERGFYAASSSPAICAPKRAEARAPRQQPFGLHDSTIFQTIFQVTIEAGKAFSLRCEERVTKIQQVRFD
jgi:hypothetical protein